MSRACPNHKPTRLLRGCRCYYSQRRLLSRLFICQDVLLSASHLRCRSYARATTYLEAHYITRDQIFKCAAGFEETNKRLRRAARVLALQRYVVLVAKVSKNAEAIKAKTLVANGPPQRKMWKRALTKSFVARDVQQELTDTRSSFAHKKDEELTFEERFHRSRENELVRTAD